jgi:hypothetical protein
VEFIHFLFENYSKRGLTKDTDRRVAASGLEARIARALGCNSRHGIFQKHLHRNLLWQVSDRKTKRIAYDNSQEVPSWSWMACGGGIEFIEVEFGYVSWVHALAFDAERDSAVLIADVGKFRDCTMECRGDRCIILDISTNNEAGWIRYDVESGAEGSDNHCVVVGRTEQEDATQQYYVLVVVSGGLELEWWELAVWRDWGPRCESCDQRNLLLYSSLRLRLPLRHTEYITASYCILGIGATVTLE